MENNVDRTHIVTKMMDMSPRKEFKAHVHVSDGHLHFHSLLKKAGNAAVATSRFFKDPIFQPEIAHFQYFIFLSTLDKMSGDGAKDHLDSESKAELCSSLCSVWAAATSTSTLPKLEGQLMGLKTGQNGWHLLSLQ